MQRMPPEAPETPVLIHSFFRVFPTGPVKDHELFQQGICSSAAHAGSMAKSWKQAKEDAGREGLPFVYHDCDSDTYGACRQGERQGSFKGGAFVEHRCVCMPAHLSEAELAEKERGFLRENPDW